MAVKTIKASGGDYTTLTAWLASLPATLTEPEIAELDAFDLADQIIINKTTSAANYIEIRPAAGVATTGVFSITCARLRGLQTNSPIRIGSGHVRIHGIQVYQDNSTGSVTSGPISFTGSVAGSDVRIYDVLLRDAQPSSTTYAMAATAANLNLTLYNAIVYGASRSLDTRGSASAKIYNSIFWRSTAQLGLVCGTEATIRNCYSGAAVSGQDCYWSGGSPTGSYNASSDTSATSRFPTGSIKSIAGSAAFTSVTAGSENFTPASGSTALINAGTTIATVTTDILGTARPQGAAYDIGAFEYVSAGGTNGTASGVVVSSTSSLVAGSASGQINATAPGATFTASSSIVAGGATGQTNATAPGMLTVATASFVPGSAAAGSAASGATMEATSSLVTGSASGQISATAAGAVMTATASLLAGSATGASGATAAGATMTVTTSLLPGTANGTSLAMLNFQAAGLEFGARTGLGIDTFAIDAGVLYRYSVHADGTTLGAAIYTSAAITLDSAGKLPNLSNAALTTGVTYRIVAIRQTDGEAATFRMVAQ